jgi:cob(I)alamin adenosyltransferase
MKSHVTTKNGDAGTTRTLAGDYLPKSHPVLECTGRLDALRAHLATLRLAILADADEDAQALGDFLFWLLHVCFLLGAEVNDPACKHPEYRHRALGPQDLARLEAEQARVEKHLDLAKAFIVSASTPLAAQADVVATVARDFERALVRLKEAVPELDAANLLPFANRLSDFLFVLARHLERAQHIAVDYSVLE